MGIQRSNNSSSVHSPDRNKPSSYSSVKKKNSLIHGKVKKLCSIFEPPHEKRSAKLAGTEDRVVIYLTSLRGIRRTFQDCHSVRMIFRGFRINLDERDISMDAAYRRELQDVLGVKKDYVITLPQVFIKGRHVGGADAVLHLLEVGELAKLLKGVPQRSTFKPCDACGDARFIPCTTCNGSRKLLLLLLDHDHDEPRRCPDCNENGLLRCPLCCR